MTAFTISFPDSLFSALSAEAHQPLADVLTIQNSPVLFGCRTGLCGTCLVHVEGAIPPPDDDEHELLDVLAPTNANARLACQIDLTCDIAIAPLANSAAH